MAVIDNLLSRFGLRRATTQPLPGEKSGPDTERGSRPTPEKSIEYLYRQMWVDPRLRAATIDIRHMDAMDGRVKKIHTRMARTAVKKGLLLKGTPRKRIETHWKAYLKRLQLDRPAKLESDARGMIMEGNLPIQWVISQDARVVACVRMPAETIVPNVEANGQFKDPMQAYNQFDLYTGKVIHSFPLWQMTLERLAPDNYDDLGCMGRPYLDASRSVWQKLNMTDEDLVIRRRTRAPQRLSHVLEGATKEDLEDYENKIKDSGTEITTDFFSNRKGSVTALQGDANLDQIADVNYLLDTFFSGAPAPKGLFGYSGELARDVLEDLKRDYFDEIDFLQDALAVVYAAGFHLDLLLQGINPDNEEFTVAFAERRTETPNQATDRALKQQALGVSPSIYWETAGLDVAEVKKRKEKDAKDLDPYPEGGSSVAPRVSVTPGNQRKGESATTVSSRN